MPQVILRECEESLGVGLDMELESGWILHWDPCD